MLANTSLPAVPYFGVFLRDLTQIVEYNPDYVRGGLINLVKRRLVSGGLGVREEKGVREEGERMSEGGVREEEGVSEEVKCCGKKETWEGRCV